MSASIASQGGIGPQSNLTATTEFPREFQLTSSVASLQSTKNNLTIWLSKEGFSAQSDDGSGFYVPTGTINSSGLVFLGQHVDTPQQIAKKLEDIHGRELIGDFELNQGLKGAIKLLRQAGETEDYKIQMRDMYKKQEHYFQKGWRARHKALNDQIAASSVIKRLPKERALLPNQLTRLVRCAIDCKAPDDADWNKTIEFVLGI